MVNRSIKHQLNSMIPTTNPQTVTLNLDLKKAHPDIGSPPIDPPFDESKNGLTIVVPVCDSFVDVAAQPAIISENSLVFADEFEKPDAQSIPLERVSWWIFSSIVGCLSLSSWFLTCLLFCGFAGWPQWIVLAAVLGLVLAMISASRYFPNRMYETTFWQRKQDGLEIRRGIWWRHRIFIPGNRIQHTDVRQGPVERRFGLATLVVNTGGTHEPSISLPGLKLAKAEELRDLLSCGTNKLSTDARLTGEPLQ